jgi:hypothetical protein
MSAAAVNLGLAEDLPDHKDLDEARSLIDALAGLLDASAIPDEPGQGPGEKYTGAVHPAAARR